MSHKTSNRVLRICIIVFLLFCAAAILFEAPVFIGIGGVIGIAGAIQNFIYDRCPSCEKYLNSFYLGEKTKFCPFCGEELEDEI